MTTLMERVWRGNSQKPEPFFSTLQVVIIEEFLLQPMYRDPILLHQKYVVEGLSIAQIAKQFFFSRDAIRRGLIDAGLTVREPHKPHGRPSQPKYGQKIRSGKASPHLTEQQMIATIRELREQGLTLRKIAKILSDMAVPTKKRGKAWHPEMVSRVLKQS